MEVEKKITVRLTKIEVQEIIADYLSRDFEYGVFKVEKVEFIVDCGNADYGGLIAVEATLP